MTPEQVHYGLAEEIQKQRAAVPESAFKEHKKRFKGKMPEPLPLPKAAWINKPKVARTRYSNLLPTVSHFH